jgi:WD40 repeat protein
MCISHLPPAFVLLLAIVLLPGVQSSPPTKAQQTKAEDVNPKTIRDLIQQLGDDSFSKREAADKLLAEIGEPALKLLREALKSPDAEIRQRADDLIRAFGVTVFQVIRSHNGHAGEPQRKATRVVVTPDGRVAISAGSSALRSWDLESGKEILVFGKITQPSYWAIAVSQDGARVFAGGEDQRARLFDLKTGKQLQEFVGHTGTIWGVALLPDGKRGVTGSWDESLRVWDLDTGKELRAFQGVKGHVRCLSISKDGKWLAACHLPQVNGPGMIRLWDVEKGTQIKAFEGHSDEVTALEFFDDDKKLLSASHDGTLRLWDIDQGKELKRIQGRAQSIEWAALTPDGKRIVSCGNASSTLRLWDVASGKELFETEVFGGGILGAAVLPDGRHAVTASRDGIVRLWHWKK